MRLVPLFRCPRSFLAIVVVGTVVAACSAFERKDIAESQVDAGSVKLSVISVAPWEDIVGKLSPSFSLTADNAVSLTLQNNAAFREASLRTLVAGLGVTALAPGSETKTETTTNADGSVSQTVTETVKDDPEDGPSLEDLKGLPDKLPGFTLTGDLAKEPIINYKAATALFQEVKLLNQYLEHAVIPEGYRPYLVRLQLAVLPNKRNQPFDIVSDLQFLPGSEILDSGLQFNYKIKDLKTAVDSMLKIDLARNFDTEKYENFYRMNPIDEDPKPEDKKKFIEALRKLNIPELENSDDLADAIVGLGGSKNINEFNRAVRDLGGLANTHERFDDIYALLKERADVDEPELDDFAASIPRVIPLLVTDSLEVAAENQVAQIAQQLSFLGAGTAGGADIRAQIQRLQNELEESQTSDLNSLFAVSQLNDNAVRIRLGARYDAANDFEMTARTHNITLLVNVPEAVASLDHPRDRRLRVLAINKMRDARTGTLLKDGRHLSKELRKEFSKLSAEYNLTDHLKVNQEDPNQPSYCLGKNNEDGQRVEVKKKGIMKKLVSRFVFYGEYKNFSKAASCMWGRGEKDRMSLRDQRLLWTSLTALTPAIPNDRIDIDLPKSTDPAVDPFGTLFVTAKKTKSSGVPICDGDDGNPCIGDDVKFANGVMTDDGKSTIVRVPLKRSIAPGRLELMLRLGSERAAHKGHYQHEFAAQKVKVEGKLLTATFPSLSAFRGKHGGGNDKRAQLIARVRHDPWQEAKEAKKGCGKCRTAKIDVFLLGERKPDKPQYVISAKGQNACLLANGTVRELQLSLVWKDKKKRNIAIEFTNATIKGLPTNGEWEMSDNDPGQVWGKDIVPGLFKFQLDDLSAGKLVTLKVGPAKEGKLDTTTLKPVPHKQEICPAPKPVASGASGAAEPEETTGSSTEVNTTDDSEGFGEKKGEVSRPCGLLPNDMTSIVLAQELLNANKHFVVIMRHADAGTQRRQDDELRSLISTGRDDARNVAAALKRLFVPTKPGNLRVEGNIRTCQTAELLAGVEESELTIQPPCSIETYENSLKDVIERSVNSGDAINVIVSRQRATDQAFQEIKGLHPPTLAVGEAAIVAKKGDHLSCLYKISPQQWPQE